LGLRISSVNPTFLDINIASPNLEKITGKPRGPLYVPVGTKLVSLNKPVTSSDMQPVIGELSFVTDGEKSGEDGYFVELGPGKQWVQVDLKAAHNLWAILVWHYHSQARVYRDVIVQVSDDVSLESVDVRPGCVVVAVRNPNHLDHLSKVLTKTDTRKIDIVALSVRLADPASTGEHALEPHQIFAEDETRLFSRVVSLAEKAGKNSDAQTVICVLVSKKNCTDITRQYFCAWKLNSLNKGSIVSLFREYKCSFHFLSTKTNLH
jgi:hypothetical protein